MLKEIGTISRLCLVFTGTLLAHAAQAAELDLGEFALDVPTAYQGPMTRQPMERITQHLFTVPGSKPQPTISVSIIKHPSEAPADIGDSDLLEISRTHLGKMMRAGTSQYADFHSDEPREIKIAGHRALEVAWTGKSNDIAVNARMFSLTTRKASYLLQVMGAADANADVQAAIKAFLALSPKP